MPEFTAFSSRFQMSLRAYVDLPELDQAGLARAGKSAIRALQGPESEWPRRGGGVRGQATGLSKRSFWYRIVGQDVIIMNRQRYAIYPERGIPNRTTRGRAARTLRRASKRIIQDAMDDRTVERRAQDVEILRSGGPESRLSRQARIRESRRRRSAWRRTAARRLDQVEANRLVTPTRSISQRLISLDIAASVATGQPMGYVGAKLVSKSKAIGGRSKTLDQLLDDLKDNPIIETPLQRRRRLSERRISFAEQVLDVGLLGLSVEDALAIDDSALAAGGQSLLVSSALRRKPLRTRAMILAMQIASQI